jgi:6-phosphogluconolactonase (cycloisomerase 2 family)
MLFPDLGVDLVRVYCINHTTNTLDEHEPLKSKTGYGPRHAVFWSPKNASSSTFLFVVHEKSNKIVSYAVTYPAAGGLTFAEIDDVSMFGNNTIPVGAAAAEVIKASQQRTRFHA